MINHPNLVMTQNELTHKIIGAAIEVHKVLGPGLLETTYERCLMHELTLRSIKAERQKVQSINYKGIELDEGYRLDLLVDNQIILELKVVNSITDVHIAQLLTYLKLSNLKVGYLFNFNVVTLKTGIRRVVNNH